MVPEVAGDEQTLLSPSIWSMLPEEILELVLQRVPFLVLVKFRLICKQWNSVIMSSEFSQACRKPNSPKCVPILVANDLMESDRWRINAFNTNTNTWLSYSLSFLENASQKGPLHLTASSGGLMCFETDDRQNIIVCNPITRRWRHVQLPKATGSGSAGDPCCCQDCQDGDFRRTVTGIIVDQQTGSYKLIIASLVKCPESERRTMIYNSTTCSWSTGAKVPQGKRFVNPSGFTCGGNLYCIVKISRYLEERTCIWKVLKYEVEKDMWCEAPVATGWLVYSFTELELVEHQEQVLLVGRVLNRRWLPNNTFYRVWYNTFYRVCESMGGLELKLVQERKIFQALDRSTGSTEFKTVVTKHPGSFAGNGDFIYTTGIPFSHRNEVQVLQVNSRTQNCKFLPGWERDNLKSKMQMEIRMLKPSLSAAA